MDRIAWEKARWHNNIQLQLIHQRARIKFFSARTQVHNRTHLQQWQWIKIKLKNDNFPLTQFNKDPHAYSVESRFEYINTFHIHTWRHTISVCVRMLKIIKKNVLRSFKQPFGSPCFFVQFFYCHWIVSRIRHFSHLLVIHTDRSLSLSLNQSVFFILCYRSGKWLHKNIITITHVLEYVCCAHFQLCFVEWIKSLLAATNSPSNCDAIPAIFTFIEMIEGIKPTLIYSKQKLKIVETRKSDRMRDENRSENIRIIHFNRWAKCVCWVIRLFLHRIESEFVVYIRYIFGFYFDTNAHVACVLETAENRKN